MYGYAPLGKKGGAKIKLGPYTILKLLDISAG
jgi:hypothetical protein